MLVDVHTHVQPPDYLKILLNSGRFEVERGLDEQLIVKEKGSRFLTVTQQMRDLDSRVAEMDAAGVDAQILSVSTPSTYFLAGQEASDLAVMCNDYLAGMVQAHPTRFRALATVPFTADIDTAIAELVRCMDVLGMPGFLMGSNIDGIPIDDPRFDPLYEEANRRGAVMFVHPMVPAGIETMNQYALAPMVGFMMDTTLAISRLVFSNFFGRFLGIQVLVSHLGGAIPFLSGRLDAGYKAYHECQAIARPPSEIIEGLYLDTVSSSPASLQLAIDTVSEQRVLFGSDYPHVVGDLRGQIDMVTSTVHRRHRSDVLGNNAGRLFNLTG